MVHFRLLGFAVSLKVRRVRTYTREQLGRSGAIVCGPDIEAQYAAQVDDEIREYEVLTELFERVARDIDERIRDTWQADTYEFGAPQKRIREFLCDLQEIASRMHAAPAREEG